MALACAFRARPLSVTSAGRDSYLRGRGSEQLELAAAFSSLGTRGFLSLFCTFRRLLRMLDKPLFVIRLRYPFIISSPLDARCLLGFFCAFGRLLGC